MKKRMGFLSRLLWAFLILCLASVGPVHSGAAAPSSQSIELRIANQSGLTACAVYLPKSTDKTWGSNRLGSRTLLSGKTLSIQVASGKYHVRVEDCYGAALFVKFNLSLTKTADLTITSPLQRRDQPPASVSRQLAGYVGGGGNETGCEFSSAGLEYPEECTRKITFYVRLTFLDFLEARDSLLVIQPPGRSRQQQVTFRGNVFDQFLPPGTATGRYAFTAVQGQRRAAGYFDVEPASSPSVRVTGEPPLLTVHLAGFEPDETFSLNIYRSLGIEIQTRDDFAKIENFVASLGPVAVDRRGEGQVALPISPSDPAGSYTIVPGTAYQNFGLFYLYGDGRPEPPAPDPNESCGRATVTGRTDLPVWDPASQSWGGAVRPGHSVELLCVNSFTDEQTPGLTWTFIRSGSLAGWADSDFLDLDDNSLGSVR